MPEWIKGSARKADARRFDSDYGLNLGTLLSTVEKRGRALGLSSLSYGRPARFDPGTRDSSVKKGTL